jgi:hypothetical protein
MTFPVCSFVFVSPEPFIQRRALDCACEAAALKSELKALAAAAARQSAFGTRILTVVDSRSQVAGRFTFSLAPRSGRNFGFEDA